MIRPLLLAIIHLKNINNIKRDDLNMLFRKLWESFCTFIGVGSGVVSIILVFATDKNLKHTIALIVLSVTSLSVLFYFATQTHRLKSKLSCLKLLAKDGHIHTARMVILRENCNNLTDIDIDKQNIACAKTAEFSWIIGEGVDGLSNVIYWHKFDFVRKKCLFAPKNLKFAPWFFGENGCHPLDCNYMIDSHDETDFMQIIPTPVVTDGSRDYAVNEGIYKMELPKLKIHHKVSKHIEIRYNRKNAFIWSRNEIFVIWPKCFFSSVEKAAGKFTIEFEGNHTNFYITADTYDCKKTFRREEAAITFVLNQGLSSTNKTVYTANEINLNPDFVYVIYIKSTQ